MVNVLALTDAESVSMASTLVPAHVTDRAVARHPRVKLALNGSRSMAVRDRGARASARGEPARPGSVGGASARWGPDRS